MAVAIPLATATATMSGRAAQVFVTRQLTVVVLVQGQQFGAGIGDLVGINDAVVIHIQRPDDGRQRGMMPMSARPRTALVTAGRRSVRVFIGRSGRRTVRGTAGITIITAAGRTVRSFSITVRPAGRSAHVFLDRQLAVMMLV